MYFVFILFFIKSFFIIFVYIYIYIGRDRIVNTASAAAAAYQCNLVEKKKKNEKNTPRGAKRNPLKIEHPTPRRGSFCQNGNAIMRRHSVQDESVSKRRRRIVRGRPRRYRK